MSQEIVREVTFFFHSVLMGLAITFFYDWILVLRKIMRHTGFWISLEDFLFWLACGAGVFYMLYRENHGILRWFAVAGAMIGMGLYKMVIGTFFINVMSTTIHKIMWFLLRVIQVMLKPLKCLFFRARRYVRAVWRKAKSVRKNVKNRLTGCIKMLRMVLCKH